MQSPGVNLPGCNEMIFVFISWLRTKLFETVSVKFLSVVAPGVPVSHRTPDISTSERPSRKNRSIFELYVGYDLASQTD